MLRDLFADLGLLIVAAAAAALFLPRLLRPRRAAEPAAAEMTVPLITDAPEHAERQAFAYDNGLTTGEDGS